MFLQLGNLFLKNNQGQKAAKIFQLFIEDSPDDFRGYFNLGKALCCQGFAESDPSDAIRNFEKALTLNPDIVDAHISIAALYIKIGEPQLAITHCQIGLELEEMNSNCMFNLNIALRQLDRLPDALQNTRSKIPSMTQVPLLGECYYQPILPQSTPHEHVFGSIPSEDAKLCCSLTIVILKWGSKYGQDYVSSLSRSLRNHLHNHLKFDIVCFTDSIDEEHRDIDDAITYRLLPDLSAELWTGWWYKAYLFSQESGLSGPVLYLDLDTVICSSIDFLAETVTTSIQQLYTPLIPDTAAKYESPMILSTPVSTVLLSDSSLKDSSTDSLPHLVSPTTEENTDMFFACLKASEITNEGRSCGLNSSIMLWNATPAASSISSVNFMHYLYTYLKENYIEITRVMYKFDHFLELMLTDHSGKFRGVMFLQDNFPNKIIDFQKAEILFANFEDCDDDEDEDRMSASIVCFPLHPKPHHVIEKAWVHKYWVIE